MKVSYKSICTETEIFSVARILRATIELIIMKSNQKYAKEILCKMKLKSQNAQVFLSQNELCLNTQNEINWSSEHSNLPAVERNQLQSTSNVEDVVSIEEPSDTVSDILNIQSITDSMNSNKASCTNYMQPY